MAKVYVKLDEDKTIVAINSDVFIKNTADWVQIDEGEGDKFAHAQANYFADGLTDEQGRYRYKMYRNKPKERTEEEKGTVVQEPSRIEKLENKLAELEKLFNVFKGGN